MSARSVSVRCWPLAIVVLFAASAPAVRAEDDVRVDVVGILATDKNNKVDDNVTCIADQMKKIDPKLTGFTMGRMTHKDVVIGGKDWFEVGDGQKVYVTVEKRCEKDKQRFCLRVEPPATGAITYTTCCEKFFPLVTRYKTKSGDVLIVAVRVTPCKGE
jgi:hypothetical protein